MVQDFCSPGTIRRPVSGSPLDPLRRLAPARRLVVAAFLAVLAAIAAYAEPPTGEQQAPALRDNDALCACDPATPASLEARSCSLCREAEKQPKGADVFFLKDINPRKPNRWLALPRAHSPGMHHIGDLSRRDHERFWKQAIERARRMWGEHWGIAINGDQVRTQCHAHAHVGKLLERVEKEDVLLNAAGEPLPGARPMTVKGYKQIPPVRGGEAIWVHPVGKRLHVHVEDRRLATEFVLLR